MSKELDDAYFRSSPCTHHEPLLSKLVDCVDLLEERIKGLLGAKVYVGDTDTLPAGSEATASASKRGYDTVLEFGIPRGKDGSDAEATDVRINGTSITADGVADIPLTSYKAPGVCSVGTGLLLNASTGAISVQDPADTYVNQRRSSQPVTCSKLDYAVKAAMCDGKGAAWTDGEQKAARERMNAVDANKVYIMQKQIENLQGIAATEETDSTEAYTKTIPIGAQRWASLDSVGGKTVVWNKLVPKVVTRSGATSGLTVTIDDNNVRFHVVGTPEELLMNIIGFPFDEDVIAGHKYMVVESKLLSGISTTVKTSITGASSALGGNGVSPIGSVAIRTARDSKKVGVNLQFVFSDTTTAVDAWYEYPTIVDITAMFGSGNEPTSIDDPRIAFIKAYAEEHPEYNPGELMSAEVVEVESRGKNLLDITATFPYTASGFTYTRNGNAITASGTATGWPFMVIGEFKAKGGEKLCLSLTRDSTEITARLVEKGTTNIISVNIDGTCVIPHDMTVRVDIQIANKTSSGTFTIRDIQVEKGTKVTEYKPYIEPVSFPIPAEVRDLCPGYGWSAGSVCNEIDFAAKKYIQRVGVVDMGTMTWYYAPSQVRFYSLSLRGSIPYLPSSINKNLVCSKYVVDISTADNTMFAVGTGELFVYDSEFTDAESLKAALQGVPMYYELAEPIEVDLSDVLSDDHYIEVEAGGTVTFKQASTQLPVPSSVTYQISTKEVVANA